MAVGLIQQGMGTRVRRRERRGLVARIVATGALAGAGAIVAPSSEAAIVLAVLAATVGAIALLPAFGPVPSHVWAPVAGAVVTAVATALPGSLIAAELLGHLAVPALILALAYLSISLDDSGFFEWCALRILRRARGSGRRLFVLLFFGVSALTFVTSNDIVILSMTPIVVYLAGHARIRNLTPFLIVLFVAANTASMGLYVGNPTNIVIAGAAGTGFLSYAVRMLVPTAVALAASFVGLWLTFGVLARRDRIQATFARTAGGRSVRWTREMTLKVTIFGCCLVAMAGLAHPATAAAISGTDDPRAVTHVVMAVSIAFALVALAVDLARDRLAGRVGLPALRRLRRMPLEIVPFFLSFCVLLAAVDDAGLTRLAAERVVAAFRHGPIVGAVATGAYGIVSVNVLNNIPASILFEKVWLDTVPAQLSELHPASPAIFVDTALFASNFGANLTYVGALAGLMWLRIVRDKAGSTPNVERFPTGRDFLRYGVILVPVVTVITSVSIALCRTAVP